MDDLLLGRVAPVVDADVAPEPQHGDPIGDLEDVVEVVRDEDDSEPLFGESADELENLIGLRDAQRGRRLVEDHDARVPHHRAADRNRLALAAGEARDRLPDRPDGRHAQALERLRRPLLHRRLTEATDEVVLLPSEVHVLDDVQVVAERKILVDDLDPELRRVLRAADRDLLPVEPRLALVDRVDAGDALDQRRLAGAVVAHERHHLAGAHLEVDVGQRIDRTEALADSTRLERRRRGGGGRGGGLGGRGHRDVVEGARGGRPRPLLVVYLQNFANSPRQTSLFLR